MRGKICSFGPWLIVGIALEVAVLSAVSGANAPDFKGKTMRIITGFAPGGSIDLRSRIFARHLGKYLPGNPKVIVQNVPGAGGVIAANYIYNAAKPDGLTIIHFPSSTFMNTFLRASTVHYDIRKMPVLWVQGDTWITVSSPRTSEIESTGDLRHRSGPVAVGGSGVTSLRTLRPRLAMELLGVKSDWVIGYFGTAGLLAALDRGEVDIVEVPLASYARLIKPRMAEGRAAVLFQTGVLETDGTFERSATVPHVPTLAELIPKQNRRGVRWDAWRAATAPQAFQAAVATPPNLPLPLLATLRRAFEQMNADSAYQKDFEKVLDQPATAAVGNKAEEVVQIGVVQLFQKYSDGVQYLKEMPKRKGNTPARK
jgi:tripartite-type tricarboxylate transporter receptor subunit TctC